MSSMQCKAIVCSTVDRPAQKTLRTPNNCGMMMSRMQARSLFVSLARHRCLLNQTGFQEMIILFPFVRDSVTIVTKD